MFIVKGGVLHDGQMLRKSVIIMKSVLPIFAEDYFIVLLKQNKKQNKKQKQNKRGGGVKMYVACSTINKHH